MNNFWLSSESSEIPCNICGGEVYEFSLPNDIWNRVVRTSGTETDKEYLCMSCFLDILRRALGLDIPA